MEIERKRNGEREKKMEAGEQGICAQAGKMEIKESPVIRPVGREELSQLVDLWKQVFGDEDQYIRLYLEHFFDENQVMALLLGGSVVSAVYMPPLGKLVTVTEGISHGGDPDGKQSFSCASIYSFGTLREYRGRGFGERLLRAALEKSRENGFSAGVICPAEDSLFTYYKGFGYEDFFSVREVEGERSLFLEMGRKQEKPEQGENMEEKNPKTLKSPENERDYEEISIERAETKGYQAVRDEFLRGLGCSFIAFDDRSLNHQKEISGLYGGGLYLLYGREDLHGRKRAGCCCVEYGESGTLLVKELLFPEGGILAAARAVAEAFPAERYFFRMPVLLGQSLGGRVRRFGMLMGKPRLDPGMEGECDASDESGAPVEVDKEVGGNGKVAGGETRGKEHFHDCNNRPSENGRKRTLPTGYYGFAFD